MIKFFYSIIEHIQLNIQKKKDVEKCERLAQTIKYIEDGANKLITWSLSIIGGSLIAIMSSTYLHPQNKYLKYGYILFLGGWFFLGKVIFHGNRIIRSNMMAPIHRHNLKYLNDIFADCNSEYGKLLKAFNVALIIFGAWLTSYLIWWILLSNGNFKITLKDFFV